MAIYTKTGDKGETSLFDGERVHKFDLRVNTYGTLDECCAVVSLSQKLAKSDQTKEQLGWIEEHLFWLNAEIATRQTEKLTSKSQLISSEDIQVLEGWIDQYTNELPPIHAFILPGTSLAGAQLHVARTVARRAERLLVELSEKEDVRPETKQFVNRLSDCLYMLARKEDRLEEEMQMIDKITERYLEEADKNAENKDEKYDRMFKHTIQVISACVEKAKEIQVPVSIAMVDKHGQLFGFYRMTGALLVAEILAKKKAYSAVAMKTDTFNLQESTQPGKELYMLEGLSDNSIVTFGGGLLMKNKEGVILGGLGISGGSVDEDMLVAKAGIAELERIMKEK